MDWNSKCRFTRVQVWFEGNRHAHADKKEVQQSWNYRTRPASADTHTYKMYINSIHVHISKYYIYIYIYWFLNTAVKQLDNDKVLDWFLLHFELSIFITLLPVTALSFASHKYGSGNIGKIPHIVKNKILKNLNYVHLRLKGSECRNMSLPVYVTMQLFSFSLPRFARRNKKHHFSSYSCEGFPKIAKGCFPFLISAVPFAHKSRWDRKKKERKCWRCWRCYKCVFESTLILTNRSNHQMIIHSTVSIGTVGTIATTQPRRSFPVETLKKSPGRPLRLWQF